MATKKTSKKERKALTLHKHYLVDIRRYADELGMSPSDFGKALETRIITRNKVKYVAIRLAS